MIKYRKNGKWSSYSVKKSLSSLEDNDLLIRKLKSELENKYKKQDIDIVDIKFSSDINYFYVTAFYAIIEKQEI